MSETARTERVAARWGLTLWMPALLALLVLVTVLVFARGPGAGADLLGPEPATVHLVIEHSRFEPAQIEVRLGTSVTFVVENRDPINHELIVGPDQVHDRHRTGTEPSHPPVPGEVSVGPGQTATTTFRFADPGPVQFACHLPGHLAYGMQGVVVVR